MIFNAKKLGEMLHDAAPGRLMDALRHMEEEARAYRQHIGAAANTADAKVRMVSGLDVYLKAIAKHVIHVARADPRTDTSGVVPLFEKIGEHLALAIEVAGGGMGINISELNEALAELGKPLFTAKEARIFEATGAANGPIIAALGRERVLDISRAIGRKDPGAILSHTSCDDPECLLNVVREELIANGVTMPASYTTEQQAKVQAYISNAPPPPARPHNPAPDPLVPVCLDCMAKNGISRDVLHREGFRFDEARCLVCTPDQSAPGIAPENKECVSMNAAGYVRIADAMAREFAHANPSATVHDKPGVERTRH